LVKRFRPKEEAGRSGFLADRQSVAHYDVRHRMGLIPKRSNPVTDVPKFKENNQRLAFLGRDEEGALLATLPPTYRPDFIISINTGLRWSEQMKLR
jgi:hypothetical protein